MVTAGIVQARMSSSRLPGKVLADIEGVPMILRQLERIERAGGLDCLVVATSTDPSDDVLAEVVRDSGRIVVRGSLNDVLARYEQAAEHVGADVVVRMTADCPLTSPWQITKTLASSHGWDYTSNALHPTYPDGLDVEVLTRSTLQWLDRNCTDPAEREHVTLGAYRRPEVFRIQSLTGAVDRSHLRWTVDEPDDLEFVRQVYRLLPEPFNTYDVLHLIESGQVKSRTTADAPRNAALQGIDRGVMA